MPVPLLFALTMFVSATLLFLVQPMVGKMILPLLGGTPAVWNTCMVFYQALLLGGYFYAHRSTTNLAPKKQTAIHTIILFAGLGVLLVGALLSINNSPIPIVSSLSPQGDDYPFFGVIVLLAVAIALPFFVVSTSAPLLSKWFAETGQPSSKNPYFLYAASNFGSLLALIAYPAIVEPNLRLVHQAWLWAIGYGLLVAMVMRCAKLVREGPPPAKPQAAKSGAPTLADEREPTLLRKLRWLGLAFVPSSLMLGVTTFVSTDMASIPLLWIIPLSLYLITFIIVFAEMPKRLKENFHLGMTLLMPVLVLLIAFLMTSRVPTKFSLQVLMHMATFFVVALVCHGELNRDKPSPKYLTNFFLIMSLGGMLGGLFNAFFAPIVFTFTSEYPITLVLACFLLPVMFAESKPGKWTFALNIILPAAVFFLCRILQSFYSEIGNYVFENGTYIIAATVLFALSSVVSLVLLRKDPRFRIALACMLGASFVSYGILGPLLNVFIVDSKSQEITDDLISQVLLKNIIRLILAVLLPAIAYAWYWNRFGEKRQFSRNLALGFGALALAFLCTILLVDALANNFLSVMAQKANIAASTVRQILIYGIPAMICYFFVERPIRFGAAVGALWLATFLTDYDRKSSVFYDRSFFGRIKIESYGQWKRIPSALFPDEVEGDHDAYDIVLEKETDHYRQVGWYLRADKSPVYRVETVTVDGVERSRFYIHRDWAQMVHGTTIHGMQEKNTERADIARALLPLSGPNVMGSALTLCGGAGDAWQFPGRDPLTYYHRTGPVGSMFDAFHARQRDRATPNTDVACIGLGTGTLSAYGLPGQKMTFFEIDTHVRRHVESPTYFTFLDSAKKQGVQLEFAMGDARISLERQSRDRKYGFMLIDAFSSDAIPAHLLTKEAVELYFQRLEEDGLLAVHISNRYIDLEPVVERICRELHLEARIMHGSSLSDKDQEDAIENPLKWYNGKLPSSWIAIAKSKEALGPIDADAPNWSIDLNSAIEEKVKKSRTAMTVREKASYSKKFAEATYDIWIPLTANDDVGLWTDDFSPIIPVLKGEWRFWSKDE